MDNLTHALMGALIGRLWAAVPGAPGDAADGTVTAAVPARLTPGRAAVAGALLANLPDLDLVTYWFSPTGYLDHHRGLSHSLVMLPVWALLIGWLLNRMHKGESVARWSVLSVAALGSHALMDWAGSYGIFLLAPLSNVRFRLDWLFIIDFVFSAILASALIGGSLWPQRRRRLAGLGVILATGYTCFGGVLHHQALEIWRMQLAERRFPAARLAAVPQAGSPLHWLLLADDAQATSLSAALTFGRPWKATGTGLAARYLNRFRPAGELQIQSFKSAPVVQQGEPEILRNYLSFARFPTFWHTEKEGYSCQARLPAEIHWRDLQYGSDPEMIPFHLIVELDEKGIPRRLALNSSRAGTPHWVDSDSHSAFGWLSRLCEPGPSG